MCDHIFTVIAPGLEGVTLSHHVSYHHCHLWRTQPGTMGNPNMLTARVTSAWHTGPPPNSCNPRQPGERRTQPPTAPSDNTPPGSPLRLGRIHAATYEPAAHVHCLVPLPISFLPFCRHGPRTGRAPLSCGVAPYSLASARLSHSSNDLRCRPGGGRKLVWRTGSRDGVGKVSQMTIAETREAAQGVGDEKGRASDFPAGTYTVRSVGRRTAR